MDEKMTIGKLITELHKLRDAIPNDLTNQRCERSGIANCIFLIEENSEALEAGMQGVLRFRIVISKGDREYPPTVNAYLDGWVQPETKPGNSLFLEKSIAELKHLCIKFTQFQDSDLRAEFVEEKTDG